MLDFLQERVGHKRVNHSEQCLFVLKYTIKNCLYLSISDTKSYDEMKSYLLKITLITSAPHNITA